MQNLGHLGGGIADSSRVDHPEGVGDAVRADDEVAGFAGTDSSVQVEGEGVHAGDGGGRVAPVGVDVGAAFGQLAEPEEEPIDLLGGTTRARRGSGADPVVRGAAGAGEGEGNDQRDGESTSHEDWTLPRAPLVPAHQTQRVARGPNSSSRSMSPNARSGVTR